MQVKHLSYIGLLVKLSLNYLFKFSLNKQKKGKKNQNVWKIIMLLIEMGEVRIRGFPTWLALSSGAKSAYRAFCTFPGTAHTPAWMHNLPSWPGRSPEDRGSGSGGTPGHHWKCGQPSCHWVWCTCKGKRTRTLGCSTASQQLLL